jgi:hypothetical protein
MIPALLVALALVDGVFAGFRAAAGRDGRIGKRDYYRGAMLCGALGASLVVALSAALSAVLVLTAADPGLIWRELLAMGARLVLVFGAFGALVALALVVYLASRHELRTLATVMILGPCTLARPWLVLGAAVWATALASAWQTAVLTWFSSALVLSLEFWLNRRFARARTLRHRLS